MQNTRSCLYLAALLHDIGKFYQRADEDSAAKSKRLTHWVINNEALLCPKHYNKGYYTHKHVLWTAQFFLDHKKDIFKNVFGSEDKADEIMMWSAKHHNVDEQNTYHKIIQKADHWASGADRTEATGWRDAEDEDKWDNFKRTQMRSVFEPLFLEVDKQNDEAGDVFHFDYKKFIPVSALSLSDDFFPKATPGDYNYAELWKNFILEFKNVQKGDLNPFSETLFNLLHKYTFTIPASTQHLPDVSLFDHSKMVAAFAVCLYDYLASQNQLRVFDLKKNEEAVLLVGGDISGIQPYLYNVVSKQAAKNLKGRSFYLQLLVDSVLDRIVKELNLFKANVVYASGGGFYLLASNTNENLKRIQNIEQELADKLFAEHKVDLFLALDTVSLSENDILGKVKTGTAKEREPNRISEKWKELIEKINAKKRTRYVNKLEQDYHYFFNEAEKGAQRLKDNITNEEIRDDEEKIQLKEDDKVVGYIKKSTYQQIELGRNLRQTNYIVKSENKINHWKLNDHFLYYANPCALNVHWYFTNHIPSQSTDNIEISVINKLDFLDNHFRGNNLIHNFTFYGGNRYPVDEINQPRYFDRLAGEDIDAFKRLGVLRMDVDNLGQAFVHGLSNERKTFSRYTALSRSLDFFFKGYINTIWEDNEDYKEWINIVYAGGDDLFVVGKWNTVIDFAETIYEKFRQWTCHNPYLTLSAGIAIVPEKFPILKAAEMAGDAEHKAKEHHCGTEEKNAICLLGMPLNWEKEYPVVKEFKKQLVERINNEQLPSGFLHKINTLADMQKRQTEKKENPSWQWIMAYDFARLKQREEKDKDLKGFIDNLQKDVICNTYNGKKPESNYSSLEMLNLAARWAELELKTRKQLPAEA